jgi:hypothetical protein
MPLLPRFQPAGRPALLAIFAWFFLASVPLFAQTNQGELRLRVVDPSGLGVRATVHIASRANQLSSTLVTTDQGDLDLQRLPFGVYQLEIDRAGFAPKSQLLDIRSSLPFALKIQLDLARVSESVTVSAANTLLDPDQAGSVNQIGSQFVQDRLTSIPGRDLQDLVNTQPGWLYEGNAVLHPRGSEYQTQFVLDGIPITDDRSPSFGPEIEADDVDSMSIYTAGIPAEYGRKMGGVVEVNTLDNPLPGFHGQLSLSGGSFDSAGAFAKGSYATRKNTLDFSAAGSRTGHYLNPVVTQNYSNTGTLADFALDYDRELSPSDRIKLLVRHEIARYDIPNELVQQAAGQRQNADNLETMGSVSYRHTFSANAMAQLSGMVRDNANDFYSNPASIPVYVGQNNEFQEGYFKAVFTWNRGHHELKAGLETDNTFLHENTCYVITQNEDDDTEDKHANPLRALASASARPSPVQPLASASAHPRAGSSRYLCAAAPPEPAGSSFSFADSRPDLEQSAFLQDLLRLNNWTLSAGLRYDHYQLILNQWQLQPRFSLSRFVPRLDTVLHFSYDRVFQTPSFENILLSSSTQVESIDPTQFLRLPVKPSVGDYFEAGSSTVLKNHLKFDANWYRRVVADYADDDQIDNTSISFPIAFRKAIIYGLEGKIEVPEWHRFSAWSSYSYQLGNVWNPVTGGLFLGDDAGAAASALSGHFPDSQDQRHTLRARARYQFHPRVWAAFGVQYDTGLPFDFDGDQSQALQEYGQNIIDRIDFARGRILPSFQVNASAGVDLLNSDRAKLRLQADGANLNNVLDVIDFGGLFSGNAIGPSRSFSLRLTTTF